MPFWKKKESDPKDDPAERLGSFRSMVASDHGAVHDAPVREAGEPVRVLTLCEVCSERMAGPDEKHAYCPAARADPQVHEALRLALQHWRGGQVQGRTVQNYSKTISLMRRALKEAMERERRGKHKTPATPASSSVETKPPT